MAKDPDPRYAYLESIEAHANRHKKFETPDDWYWRTLDVEKGIQCYKDALQETFKENFPSWLESMRKDGERVGTTE